MSTADHKVERNSAPGLPLADQSTRQLAIMGIDGSGKSTVARFLAEQSSLGKVSCLISDRLSLYHLGERLEPPIDPAERIRPGINQLAKHAGSLRLYKLPKLVDLFLRDRSCRHFQDRILSGVIIMDGSPLLNMIAWASLYRESPLSEELCARSIGILTGRIRIDLKTDPILETLPELKTICRLRLNRMALPDECVFLDVCPETACSRICSRGESLQVHETADRLTRLREAYLKVCQAVEEQWQVKVHLIDADKPVEEVQDSVLQAMG